MNQNIRNKGMMRSAALALLSSLAICLLLLTGCPGGGGGTVIQDDPYHQGKEGVIISFAPNSPPKTVYENDEFNVMLTLQNKGAFSLSKKHDESGNIQSDDKGIITSTFDPFYFDQTFEDKDKMSLYLEGKGPFAPKGDGIIQEYGYKSKPLLGQREHPTTTLLYTICYPYQTTLTQVVCIDKDYYNLDSRKKVCQIKDITLSKGQGAPIAITKIEPRALKREDDTLIEFVITIENAGGGNVITRDKNKDVETQCTQAKPDREEWNGVAIHAELLGTQLECGPVKLKENKAEVRCRSGALNTDVYNEYDRRTDGETTVTSSEYVGQARNFLSTLYVTLDYIYQASASKQVTIQR
jgi:hypothetical protein